MTGAFCAGIKERSDLSIIILAGFTRNEIERDPVMMRAAGHADMIHRGPLYNARLCLASGLRAARIVKQGILGAGRPLQRR